MKLVTKEIERKLPALYSTEKTPEREKKIVAKFFSLRSDWTWYAVEGQRQPDGDIVFYGLVNGFDREYGYFTLRELESVRFFGIPGIERDMYFGSHTIGDVLDGIAS